MHHFLDHIYLYCALIFYVVPLILFYIHRYIMYFYISIPFLALCYLWVEHFFLSSQPNYNGGPGEGLGVAIAVIITLGLILGVTLCLITNIIFIKLRRIFLLHNKTL